jgi:hypothetical protein
MMKGAPHVLADYFANTQVRPQVAAVGAHHRSSAAFPPIDDRTAFQKITPEEFAPSHLIGPSDCVPTRMKTRV